MSNSELKMVSLGDIEISGSNPRKTFDEQAMKELTDSIKQHGVLQPVLIRNWESVGKRPKGKVIKKYQLVCGERRYKAAQGAGLGEIPCNIRELTDDEAFELQIVENLERKDVHPLEEAEAFKKLIDSGKYTISDIAAKLAKAETYIVQRLKLNDLTDALKKDFYEGLFGIGHAVILARVSEKQQLDIKYEATDSTWARGYGTISSLKSTIERGLNELNKAPFNTKDGQLIPKCVSCEVCPKRSGANKTLFPDIEQEDICFDVMCYESKVTAHIENRISKIVDEAEDILLGVGYNEEAPDFIKKIAKQNKIPILKNYDDFTHGSGKGTKRLLWVSGHKAGHIETVRLEKKAVDKGATSEEQTIEAQIAKIGEREKRAKELDNEKVEAAIREKLESAPEHRFHSNEDFKDSLEIAAAIFAISEKFGYKNKEWLILKFFKDKYISDWSGQKLWDKLLKNADKALLNECLRRLVLHVLTDRQVADKKSNAFSDAFYQICSFYHPADVELIQIGQDEIATKRTQRVDAKIKTLKKSMAKKVTQ